MSASNCSDNDIGDAGAAALSSALTGCKQLITLDLRCKRLCLLSKAAWV